jgi:diguanylate cyclase (GGDEF)-like protein
MESPALLGSDGPGAETPFADGRDLVRKSRIRLATALFGLYIVISALGVALIVGGSWAGTGWTLVGVAALIAIAVGVSAGTAFLARWTLEPTILIETERRRLIELYEWARLDALRDPLTGLGNQRAFEEELDRWVDRNRRSRDAVALAIIDIDNLKAVNDMDGHAAGDAMLTTLGRLIATSIRRSDMAFRIGGDEFALLLPATSGPDAHALVRRMLANALEGQTAIFSFASFSFSAGVAAFPDPSADGSQLRRHADAALYWSKRHGRTSVELFDPAHHATTGDDRSLAELSQAVMDVVAGRALGAVYQPIYSITTGEPVGFEGLVRPDASTGFADASSLFIAAESAGRTVELDLAALDTLIAGAGALPDGCYLSLNLSPRTLETAEFSPVDVTALLARQGIAPDRVVLELTERESTDDIERLRANLAACRRAGIRIAVDDVGAGNAGLRLLSQISFDVMKVDLSLVQRGLLGETGLSVLRALSDLAERRGATVVAEGVETPQHLHVVRSLGLHAAQGYLLARPAPAIEPAAIDLDAILQHWGLGAMGLGSTERLGDPASAPA